MNDHFKTYGRSICTAEEETKNKHLFLTKTLGELRIKQNIVILTKGIPTANIKLNCERLDCSPPQF